MTEKLEANVLVVDDEEQFLKVFSQRRAALFWDLCKDKTITDGRHPANVCCVMTSPLNGTIVPSAGGRCEVVGVGVGMHPISWFTRSGFGGRFSTLLKYAGWDGIVIEGRADSPVWVDIRDGQVTFHDAGGLWGKDTWTTQHEITNLLRIKRGTKSHWQAIGSLPFSENEKPSAKNPGRTTQKPAILCIGPARENQTIDPAGSFMLRHMLFQRTSALYCRANP